MSGTGTMDSCTSPDSELSGDSETEGMDAKKHVSMLKSLAAMDTKRRRVLPRGEAFKMEDFQTRSSNDEVKLNELIMSLKKNPSQGGLKKKLDKMKKKDVLAAPLSKPEQGRVRRHLAYETVGKDLKKWDPVVNKNRVAEQSKFPLDQSDLRVLTSAGDLLKRMKPTTSLEVEIAALLGSGEHVLAQDKVLTPAEERALQAMSLEDAQERRAELQKYRALLSYKESKARRQKKIKSKKYHRILQKEKLKKEKASLAELKETDPQAFLDKLQDLDSNRLTERISLKHRGGSKFAKKQAMYNKFDEKSREAVQEMLQKSRQLTQKVAVETSSEEEEEDTTLEVEGQATKEPVSSSNPWMTQTLRRPKQTTKIPRPDPAIEMQRTDSSTNDSDSEEEMSSLTQTDTLEEIFSRLENPKKRVHVHDVIKEKKKKKKAAAPQEDKSDDEDALESEEDDKDEVKSTDVLLSRATAQESVKLSLTRKQTLDDFDDKFDEDEQPTPVTKTVHVPHQEQSEKANAKQNKDNAKQSENVLSVDPNKFTSIGGRGPNLVEDDDDEEDNFDDHTLTIAEAFASDHVVEEFLQEKDDIKERDKPKDINLTLPGWGDWGGKNIQPSRKKRKRFTIKAPAARPRLDRNLDNVIISEVKDKTIAKHQVGDLPFPFTDPKRFQSSIRQPIGKTWNPETAYKSLIKPKVVTRIGTVIEPMDKKSVFKNQKQKRHSKGTNAGDKMDLEDGTSRNKRRKKM